MTSALSGRALSLDCPAEIGRIAGWLAQTIAGDMKRRGAVVALSGGVDSSVCAALAVRACGPAKVLGLALPENESSPSASHLGRQVAAQLGVECLEENIGPALEAIGCYRRRDEAIRRLFPDYDAGWKSKIVIGGAHGGFNYFKLVVQTPEGELRECRLPSKEYMQIVAATSFKQRLRKTIEYFHADRLHYAVIGTPNRLEYDQGFFVKNGDGSADVKPIAHLYKSQVYALARALGLPDAVCNAAPTTDTYSLSQGQDEFYFTLPYRDMDMALWAFNRDVPPSSVAAYLGVSVARAQHVYDDIRAKRAATRYQHAGARLIEPIEGIGDQ